MADGVRKIKRRSVRDDDCPISHEDEEFLKAASTAPEPTPKTVVRGELDLGLFDGAARHRVALGIDSSATAFGLAALSLDDGRAYAWVFKPKLKEVDRLAEIDDWLQARLRHLKLRSSEVVISCMEAYGFAGQKGHTIGEVGGVAKLAILRVFGTKHAAARPVQVAPNSLKKWTTGSGNAEKSDMKLAIFRKWGVEFKDDNQADAFALATLGAALVSGVTGHAYESDVIKNLERQWAPPQPTTS